MFNELSYQKLTSCKSLPFCVAFCAGNTQDGNRIMTYPTQNEGYTQSLEELLSRRKEIALRAAFAQNEFYILKNDGEGDAKSEAIIKQVYIVDAPHCLVRLSQAETSVDIFMRNAAPLCRSAYPATDGLMLSIDRNYVFHNKNVRVSEVIFIEDAINERIEVWNKFGHTIWCAGQPWPMNEITPATHSQNKKAVRVPRYSFAERETSFAGADGPAFMYLPTQGGQPSDLELDRFLVPSPPVYPVRVTQRGYLKVDDRYAPVTQ